MSSMTNPRSASVGQPTICGAGQRLRGGRLTCVELLEQCLSMIDDREAELAAWVHVDRRGALDQARERDRELAQGVDRGCLHGIPVGIKDIIDVAGTPTGGGSKRLEAGPPAAEDAVVVTKLRQAGAVILGKTVTTAFACYDPPVTRNPWNADHTPGGSSSGSAVAVATGMCYAALGSQTGGSITRPAAYCGVAGLKPTFRSVHMGGVLPVALALDHIGPLARCVTDLAAVFSQLRGDDGKNPSPVLDPDVETPVDLVWPLPETQDPIRIGRLPDVFAEDGDPEAMELLDRAIVLLTDQGAEGFEACLPGGFAAHAEHHRRIMACEAAAFHDTWSRQYPEDYPPGIRALIDEGRRRSATEYISSRSHQIALRAAVDQAGESAEIWVCLSAPGPAPGRETTGSPAFNVPWSYLGLPTVTFPVGQTSNGLPIGMQLIGRRNMDVDLLSKAAWCEATLQGDRGSVVH
ncbi:MAG: amidase [Planctomycetaceae bacterium]